MDSLLCISDAVLKLAHTSLISFFFANLMIHEQVLFRTELEKGDHYEYEEAVVF